MKRALHFLILAAALLIAPAFGQVAVDTGKTGTGQSAVLLRASAVPVIIPSSGSSNATGQITHTTALPAQPTGSPLIFLPAGVVTAGSQGTGAGLYQVTYSSTTVCQLTGTGIVTANAAYTQVTTEQALSTTAIPGSAMALSGGYEVRSRWTMPTSANAKTVRHRLGGIAGQTFGTTAYTTDVLAQLETVVRNRNSTALQYAISKGTRGTDAVYQTTTGTGAVDTTASQDSVTSGQIALATEFLILESIEVWLLP